MTPPERPVEAALPVVALADATEAADRAAEDLAALVRAAVRSRGIAHVAVSGGTTPWRMLAEFDRFDLPWDRLLVHQVDERLAPDGHPDRNLTRLRTVLPYARLHPVPVSDAAPEEIARAYAAGLPDRFDVIHLGLGADGHTASLVPGDAVLDVDDAPAAATATPYAGRVRITLTFPTLARARAIQWLVTGPDKRVALRQLLEGDRSIPAGRVARHAALVFTDADTAAAPS